jgi:hypothetical protein
MQDKPVYVVLQTSPEGQAQQSRKSALKFVLFTVLAVVIVGLFLFFPTSHSFSSNNSSKAAVITANWENCTMASTCGAGFTCCAAYPDLASGKKTCRQAGLAPNNPLGCGSTAAVLVKEWATCYAGSTCSNGFTCCVAPDDVASGKRTCRRSGLAPNVHDGCAASTFVPVWQTCYAGSVCANGFTCCVAPDDVVDGKRTCRQPGLAPNAHHGCAADISSVSITSTLSAVSAPTASASALIASATSAPAVSASISAIPATNLVSSAYDSFYSTSQTASVVSAPASAVSESMSASGTLSATATNSPNSNCVIVGNSGANTLGQVLSTEITCPDYLWQAVAWDSKSRIATAYAVTRLITYSDSSFKGDANGTYWSGNMISETFDHSPEQSWPTWDGNDF